METTTILPITLKNYILMNSFGGVMYDVTEGSKVTSLVKEHKDTAIKLAKLIDDDPNANGIDKGVSNFIKEVLV